MVSNTMALVTSSNSIMAILAGLVCHLLVSTLSLPVLSPFIAAVPCLLSSLAVISFTWTENYGEGSTSLLATYKQGLFQNVVIHHYPCIICHLRHSNHPWRLGNYEARDCSVNHGVIHVHFCLHVDTNIEH